MSSTTPDGSYGAPPLALLGVEPLRAVLEYASMRLMNKDALPAGDGHPVVIFPGLATDRHSIGPLKGFWLDELSRHVCELTSEHDDSVSLVGWSLGGIYARELAKKLPRRVRQVVTIGTPFAGTAEQTNVAWVYRLVNGQKPALDEALVERLRTPPAVPTTSIYSRTDGVVAWQACLNPEPLPHVENIEVDGSHCGLGWNPKVLSIVADRLRQPEGAWRPHASAAAH
ncbi:MAG TPA: alpha/beta hydrolase [Albitalea sp.]